MGSMNKQVVGTKLEMIQKFDLNGKRLVVTVIKTEPDQKLGFLKAGDPVKVSGLSKGKGFTGVVKRWGFKGGPRTHGQSDRQRAPGSIGQGTDPGRVFPGKKMPGRAGGKKVTIAGLRVFETDEKKGKVLVTGPVPGSRNCRLVISLDERRHKLVVSDAFQPAEEGSGEKKTKTKAGVVQDQAGEKEQTASGGKDQLGKKPGPKIQE